MKNESFIRTAKVIIIKLAVFGK